MKRALVIAAAFLAPTIGPGVLAQSPVGVELAITVPDAVFAKSRSRDVLIAQVFLDRARHSPGTIDGFAGRNTTRAIRAYQRAAGRSVDGKLIKALLQRLAGSDAGSILQPHTLTQEEVSGPFANVPSGFAAMAELDRVGYESPAEKIAEQFHMHEALLRAPIPNADFGTAGSRIIVVALRDAGLSGDVARIEVDRWSSAVRAYAAKSELLATYSATVGSGDFPSPDGSMKVRAVAPQATNHFSPEGREWGTDQQLTIAAGPNNPVGGIWIDLAKDGYGIHGSPHPNLIGTISSHGCVRLTNWDARELSGAVSDETKVQFM